MAKKQKYYPLKNYIRIPIVILLAVAILFWLNPKEKIAVAPSEFASEKANLSKNFNTPPPESLNIPILMYHHVGELPAKASAIRKDLTLSTETFTKQVKWLKEQGFSSISLEQLYLAASGDFQLPEKPVIFSFDDGYEDVFINAVPILEQYQFRGSFGIITQYPENSNETDNLYASWEKIKSASDRGHEIVSHTQTHFDGNNSKYTNEYIFENLQNSKNDILKNTGKSTRILIYPYGSYTTAYIEQAKNAGFVMGLTVKHGNLVNTNNLMEVPRLRIHGNQNFEKFKKLFSN